MKKIVLITTIAILALSEIEVTAQKQYSYPIVVPATDTANWYKGLLTNEEYFENRYELCKYMAQFEGINIPLSDPEQMRNYLFGDDESFNEYTKEKNINWKERNDSIMRFMIQQREELLKSVEKKVE